MDKDKQKRHARWQKEVDKLNEAVLGSDYSAEQVPRKRGLPPPLPTQKPQHLERSTCDRAIGWLLGRRGGQALATSSPSVGPGIGCLILIALVVFAWIVFKLLGFTDDPQSEFNAKKRLREAEQSTTARNWYEGGTLHNKSALEWQRASEADKLATCGDLVLRMAEGKNLKPYIGNSIRSADDIRPYARELVDCLNAAMKPVPDAASNRELFANQTVTEMAAGCVILMGWTN